MGKERVVCNKVHGVDISFMDDALYGTYDSSGYGAIYKMSMSGVERALYTFKGGRDGASPRGPVLPVNGLLYGTTSGAGGHGHGTIFKVLP
ncbi:MAG: choice-of-anchor tandem repeat GloVer-containing protein [Candidatus Cybelea sp.]